VNHAHVVVRQDRADVDDRVRFSIVLDHRAQLAGFADDERGVCLATNFTALELECSAEVDQRDQNRRRESRRMR
jgi:hypothetical protein